MNTFISSIPVVFLTLYAAITDLQRAEIDNWVSVAIIIYSVFIKITKPAFLLSSFFYGLIVFISLFVSYVLLKDSIGGGDVKLLSALALFFEKDILFLILIACILGFAYGLIKGIVKKTGLKTITKFGPFIFIATLITSLSQGPVFYITLNNLL